MTTIKNIFYINLDRRPDRRAEIESELALLGLSGERIPGVPTGACGCLYSHLNGLKYALENDLEYVIMLEDDFQAVVDPDTFRVRLEGVLNSDLEFDVLLLSYNMIRSEPVPGRTDLVKALDAQTTAGYLIRRHYYQALIDVLEWAHPLLQATGQHWNYAIDQAWKRLQPLGRWYAFSPRLGIQRESYSDLAGHVVNYGV